MTISKLNHLSNTCA